MTGSFAFSSARRIIEVVLLAAFTLAVYAVLVIGGGALIGDPGQPNVVLAMAATSIIAVALPAVRTRARAVAARVTLGKDRDPYEILVRAAERLGGAMSPEEALPRTAEIVARGTESSRAEVWLRVGDRLRLGAAWPEDDIVPAERPLPPHGAPEFPEATHSVPVLDGGRVTGAVAVYAPDKAALDDVEKKLLEGLASHAGLVVRDLALTAELRDRLGTITAQAHDLDESRRRILEAQAEERRRLERAIHDGAQQHLVSLAVKLRLARAMAPKDPTRARRLLGEVHDDVDAALASLRDLARGIYPPVLSDRGIAAALGSHVSKMPHPVRIVDDTDGRRFDRSIEAAVYFCCVEALRPASAPAEVRLTDARGTLSFTVAHERPVPPESVRHLEDRIASFDGVFESHPRRIFGRVPLPSPDATP
ncbi:MAG TPA: histidine kinase [Actinomycetota bacterium]|nr:histidine kinase [Actinomycetota bacterium]